MNAVDTNVLLYFYDDNDLVRKATATSVIKSVEEGVLLWQVACEFIAASRKLATAGLGLEVAWSRLDELRELFPLVIPTSDVLAHARALTLLQPIHFWDAMIYAACIDAGVTRLYSEDVPGQPIQGLEIVNPFHRAS